MSSVVFHENIFTVNKNICYFQIPKTTCATEPVTKCNTVSSQRCSPAPRTACTTVTLPAAAPPPPPQYGYEE